jgi:hypothetical protein
MTYLKEFNNHFKQQLPMIFPDEYKRVGVKRSTNSAAEELIYFLTDYLIVEKENFETCNDNYGLYYVKKSGGGLLRKVEYLKLIASGEKVVKYDEELNIRNRTLLIKTAANLCADKVNTIIFTGLYTLQTYFCIIPFF